MRDFRRRIPQITEFFDQHRGDFDTLRTGEFATYQGVAHTVWRHDNASLRLSYTYGESRTTVEQRDWHTIAWLPNEEKDAILSIMDSMLDLGWSGRSPSIGTRTATLRRTGGGGYSEGIVIFFPGIEPQISSDDWAPPGVFDERTEVVALGDGYHLFMYVSRGPGGMGAAFGMMSRAVNMLVIIVLAIVLFFLYWKWYIISAKNKRK